MISVRAFTPTVMMHAFKNQPNGDREYFDAEQEPEKVDGWCVWIRKDYAEDDFDDEPDAEREYGKDEEDEAKTYARQLAKEWQAEIESY